MVYNIAMAEGEDSKQLEQDIIRLEQDIASKRLILENQRQAGEIEEVPSEKETLHEIVRERINEIPDPVASPSNLSKILDSQNGEPSPDLPLYLSVELKAKIQELVQLAFVKSIAEAIKAAKATGNAALIDAFHDALTDELYDRLVERGKLKKF